MNAIKKVRKYMSANPETGTARTLARLVLALETEQAFALSDLYQLDYDAFQLALDLLKDWRLDRYYTAKGQLLDITLQVADAKQ
jgi:ATP-dependent protease HslVU (ClpYQ) peptidase subunit